ncbi:MAG: hypothetical protein C4541_00690 [Candidatus Auribacter fodinae]|uniref:Discoidin domain-containing protein n=1 Tax=Candidatus Auribacter fodinae TaxID=2093366 RepID=A0A3A4RH94_9BACT|nr:MAG: hypothetical protein C4541_00690 [Candidatus Auribacter fodinae]
MRELRLTLFFISLCGFLLCGASSIADETKINFLLVSGGSYNDSSMITTASGIAGDVYWISTKPPYSGDTRYFMQHIIDNQLASGTYDNYWLPAGNNDGSQPGTNIAPLRVIFPHSVYITKIRTYNVVDINSGIYKDRWSESKLFISDDGSTFVEKAAIEIDANPHFTDYVDIYINDYVFAIDYQPSYNPSHDIPDYYVINEIEMYTDDEMNAVPEPLSVFLLGSAVAVLVKKSVGLK